MDTDLHLWFFNNLSALLKGECIRKIIWWWPRRGSNARHRDFQSLALPTELPGHIQDAKEKIVGFEPTTFCLTDKCSTNELNFFLKEKIAVCVFNYGCGGLDSNQRPSGYEPDELPAAPPRVVAEAGFEPAISNL